VVDEAAIRGVFLFTVPYLLLFAVATVFSIVNASRVGYDLTTLESASTAIATPGNIGPGFGSLGMFGSYLRFPNSSKLLTAVLMWFGRLEIVPVLALLVGTTSD
jgi:trk system potassium uptake protein TrkH